MVRPPLRAPRVKNNLYRSRARPTRLGAPFVRTVRPWYVCEGMRAFVAGLLLATVWLAEPRTAAALSVQEAILRAKPAVALVTAEIRADVTMNCGQGPVEVSPAPFIETGTGWFVDGRGFLITNAYVVDPAHRLPPWVTHELKKKAIEQACVEPALRARGLIRGPRPEVEEQIRRQASDVGLATAKVAPVPKITVMLSNGTKLTAEVKKFSPPLLLDNNNRPLPDSGRDLALLRVKDGVYPAIALAKRDSQIGDPVHILGFPGVVLSHELLNKSAALEASVTNGAVSGFKQDQIGQGVIQSDAPAAHGNSGGPAVTDDATVVGVMTFISLSSSGSEVQGFNFLIPAKDVAKFLEGTEVTKPGESAFNPVWGAGIEALLDGHYSSAVAKFQEANKLLPGLTDVKRLLTEAEDKVKNPPPRPFPWAWATLGVTLLSLGAYGGMWGRRWWKNRFRVQPTQVIALIERGLNPVMLDVRTKTDYETSPLKLPGAVRLDPESAETANLNLEPARLPVEAKSSLPSIGLEIYKNLSLGDIERRRFRAGEVIFREGDDPRGEAYVIHAGTVEIKRRLDGAERTLNRLGEGQLFGHMALFRKGPRSASAIAASDTELLVIRDERLEWLMRNRPQLTIEVLKELSNLVVATDKERAEASAVR